MNYSFPAVDTHTHTVVSGHAFSTLLENVQYAKKKNLYGICETEHGCTTPGAQPAFIPVQQRQSIPQFVDGVRVYCGVEANIIEYDGTLDVPVWVLERMEIAIASFHNVNVNRFASLEEVTEAYRNVIRNPYIDIIGHPDSPFFPYDFDEIAREASLNGKILELNCNSLTPNRKGSLENVYKMLSAAKSNNTFITVGSDAHFCTTIGAFESALSVIEEVAFPRELIITATPESFEDYLSNRSKRI